VKRILFSSFLFFISLGAFSQSNALVSFIAMAGKSDITLRWAIAVNANCGSIALEYSTDSLFSFPSIIYTDNVPLSSSVLTFQYTHTTADRSVKNYYRLNLGACGYSQIIGESVGGSLNYKLYPNPLNQETCTIIFDNPKGKICKLYIFDRNGQLLRTGDPFQGNTVQFLRNGLDAAMYYFVVSDLSEVYVGGKFIISDL
jgi:hypothetical protein